MPWVYILKSERNGRYYIGYTADIARRLSDHQGAKVKATRHLRPWALVYSEEHPDATAARKREWYLKRQKSRRFLEALIAAAVTR